MSSIDSLIVGLALVNSITGDSLMPVYVPINEVDKQRVASYHPMMRDIMKKIEWMELPTQLTELSIALLSVLSGGRMELALTMLSACMEQEKELIGFDQMGVTILTKRLEHWEAMCKECYLVTDLGQNQKFWKRLYEGFRVKDALNRC